MLPCAAKVLQNSTFPIEASPARIREATIREATILVKIAHEAHGTTIPVERGIGQEIPVTVTEVVSYKRFLTQKASWKIEFAIQLSYVHTYYSIA